MAERKANRAMRKVAAKRPMHISGRTKYANIPSADVVIQPRLAPGVLAARGIKN